MTKCLQKRYKMNTKCVHKGYPLQHFFVQISCDLIKEFVRELCLKNCFSQKSTQLEN